jgi:hypothetical protein
MAVRSPILSFATSKEEISQLDVHLLSGGIFYCPTMFFFANHANHANHANQGNCNSNYGLCQPFVIQHTEGHG